MERVEIPGVVLVNESAEASNRCRTSSPLHLETWFLQCRIYRSLLNLSILNHLSSIIVVVMTEIERFDLIHNGSRYQQQVKASGFNHPTTASLR